MTADVPNLRHRCLGTRDETQAHRKLELSHSNDVRLVCCQCLARMNHFADDGIPDRNDGVTRLSSRERLDRGTECRPRNRACSIAPEVVDGRLAERPWDALIGDQRSRIDVDRIDLVDWRNAGHCPPLLVRRLGEKKSPRDFSGAFRRCSASYVRARRRPPGVRKLLKKKKVARET